MPTVIWIIGVSAFFLLIVEAIFAGPLWAIAHLSMEGHGMGGQQARRGYVFLLALVLTPVLMLLGLFVGMILFRITGILLNQGIYYALTATQVANGDGFTQIAWFFGVFVVLVFMILVYIAVIERSFSLIAEFPGRLFRWFDHHAAQDLDTHAAARVNAAALATGGGADRAIGSGGQTIADQSNRARIGRMSNR
jgi:conjugal transfer/type IV secretion protein DotA/TraY